jgi:alpha-methylacyl-CoA racemase
MLLSDAGASVLRVDRAVPGQTHTLFSNAPPSTDPLARRKSSIAVNIKSPGGVSLIRELVQHVDVVIDPFRPGVLEKLGLGPRVLCDLNHRLIYARLTGFRRDGKYAGMAGHDINYLAVSGVLGMLGRSGQKPHAPINLLADFAGGGAVLFQGILLALMAREACGNGQVVEANMVDGSSYLASFPRFQLKAVYGGHPRGENVLDGGCPWYDTYETKDGKYMAVGALEPRFFDALVERLGLESKGWRETRHDRDTWPEMRAVLESTFMKKTRRVWEDIFDGSDACCVPVLDYSELETDTTAEGDQRPITALRSNPLLGPITSGSHTLKPGYHGDFLGPGVGGEDLLQKWLGWRRGHEFEVGNGGLVLKVKSKL